MTLQKLPVSGPMRLQSGTASALSLRPAAALVSDSPTCLVGDASCSVEKLSLVEQGPVLLIATREPVQLVRGGSSHEGRACDEAQLDSCIAGGGGATCVDQHCESSSGDNICASDLTKTCLEQKGGTGCKKFCGHPVACFRAAKKFACDSAGCRCLSIGAAPEDPVGNSLIELVGTGALSVAQRLATKVVGSTLALAASGRELSRVASLATSLDDSFGRAFSMGARAGLRLSAHAHELVDDVIREAPSLVRVPIKSPRKITLPALGSNADRYIWLIDDAGNFIVAPEVKLSARETLGHPTLCRGCSARIAGEIFERVGDDGVMRLVINNQSGRYFNDFERGAEHLERAGQVLGGLTGRPVTAEFMNF